MWNNVTAFLKLFCARKAVQDCRQGIFAKSKSVGLINLGDFSHESSSEWQSALLIEHPAILFNWEKNETIEPIFAWKFAMDPTEELFPVLCIGTHGSRHWLTLTTSSHVVGMLAPPPDDGWRVCQPQPQDNG